MDYYTIGVVFDPSSSKQYTYKVYNDVSLAVGDYVAVSAPGLKVAMVKAVHNEPKDTEGYDYKFIAGTVVIIPPKETAPCPKSPSRL